MNAYFEMVNHPFSNRVGWALLHSLWQGALAAIFLKLLRMAMRRNTANCRYLIACAVLFVTAALPVLTLIYQPETGFGWIGDRVSQVQSAADEFADAARSNASAAFATRNMSWLESAIPWFSAVWAVGVFVSLARLLQGYWRLGRLRSHANSSLDPAWLETLQDLKCRLNVSRPVRLLKSGIVEVPMVMGWLSPIILLPAGSLLGLTPSQVEAILAHELAHIRRHDYLVNLFQVLIESLMFYHPAVWWISRCIREERENCCDDLVMGVCEDRLVYAEALTRLEELRSITPQLAFAANGGPLLKRIRRLVGVSNDERPLSVREISGLTLIALGLLLIIAGFSLLLITPPYQAVARMKLEQDTPWQFITNDRKVSLNLYDPYFIQTELAVISSDAVLTRVLAVLKLDEQWSQRYGGGQKLSLQKLLALLKARLELKPVRSTGLIDILASSDKPEEAARIANGVANAYKEHHQYQREQMGRGSIASLEESFKRHEKEIEEAQRKANDWRDKLQIPDALASMDRPPGLITAETLRKLESQRIETKTELVKQEVMLSHLKKLSQEELIQAIPTVVLDTQFSSLLEARTKAEQTLASRRHTFGPESEEIQASKSEIGVLNDRIQKRAEGILFSLAARAEALKSGLDALETEVNVARTNDIIQAQQTQPYYDAKNKVEQLKRFAQMLSLKIATENIDKELPKSVNMEIISEARTPTNQTSPNRYRGTACSAIGLLLTVAGMMMVKQATRVSPTPRPG